MKPPRWSAREMEMLEQMLVDHPYKRVPNVYNAWAVQAGFVLRTGLAIRRKAASLRVMDKASGDWVSAGYICAVLDVSLTTPKYWANRHEIPCYQDGRRRRYFQRSVLRSAARKQPEIFGGISADRLFLLLEDRDLADGIAARFTRRGADPKPVRAIETGWLYPSITAAAKRMGVRHSSIYKAINNGHRSAGYHWTHA